MTEEHEFLELEEVVPDAARVIEGLRDTGYDFLTAVADIVDNSIAAEATRVDLRVTRGPGGHLEVTIADNGYGMDHAELRSAMKYGSPERISPSSLGKFGLGLKTASTAICRRLTVVSRPGSLDGPWAAEWDLDFVSQEHKWLLKYPEPTPHESALLDRVAEGGSGTVVIWRNVDRLLGRTFKNPEGRSAQNALNRSISELRRHLGLTYCRYILGENGRATVQILLNDEPIQAWDPFWRLKSEVVTEQHVPVEIDGAPAELLIRAYVLPPRSELTPDEEKEARIETGSQGFYVFREDRVISSGGWLGMFGIEPHLNLCRIELSFDHRLDDALQIDIKKSRIRMLADLHDFVKQQISPARAEATKRYRDNQRSVIQRDSPNLHEASNTVVGNHIDEVTGSTVTVTGADMATVSNPRGEVQIRIPTIDDVPGGPYVVVREDLADGLLWQPGIVERKHSVLLNAGHPYYQRAYAAIGSVPVAVQAVDFLLWSLCEAELYAMTEDEKEHMGAVRREVSRITRKLAATLPETEAQG